MKIRIGLNPKSIEDAIKKLNGVKKKLRKGEPLKELFEEIYSFFIARATFYLYQWDIGMEIKESIKESWKCEITKNSLKIINDRSRAVFVEFGVGIVGESSPHPNAQSAGYEYNVQSKGYGYNPPSFGKQADGTWGFTIERLSGLDLPKSAVSILPAEIFGSNDVLGYHIESRGTKGAMYAYNALMDVAVDLQDRNGTIATAWKRILRRYLQ